MFKWLFNEKCPKCSKVLDTNKSNIFTGKIVKSCSEGHYTKEFHPTLETFIETN
jgi:phage FluMu protein Com